MSSAPNLAPGRLLAGFCSTIEELVRSGPASESGCDTQWLSKLHTASSLVHCQCRAFFMRTSPRDINQRLKPLLARVSAHAWHAWHA